MLTYVANDATVPLIILFGRGVIVVDERVTLCCAIAGTGMKARKKLGVVFVWQ